MSGVLRFDQLDTTRQRVIQQNLATLKAKGASDADIESYLRDDEKLAPVMPGAPTDATSVGNASVGHYSAFTGPGSLGEMTANAISAVPSSFFRMLSPGVGEARPNPNLSKGGNSSGAPLGGTYDAEHGAVTSGQRAIAAAQTAANIAAPALARTGMLGRLAGNAALGAAYDPERPIVGAGLGLGAGEVLHGTGKVLGATGSKLLDATGARPVSYTGVPTLSSQARDFTNKLLFPLTNDPSLGLGERPQGPVLPDAFGSEVPTLSTRRINGPEPTPQKGALLKATARALGVQSQEQQVDRTLSNAARLSGITPAHAANVPVQSPTTALDLAQPGSPLHRVVRQAYNVPTSTAQPTLRGFFADRSAGTGERVQTALTDATGAVPTDTDLPIEARIEQRAKEAKPLYEQAYAYGQIKDPETIQQVQTLLKNPTFAKAWKRGQALSELEGTAPQGNGISAEDMQRLKEQGLDKFVPQADEGPTVQQLDYWKRGLDAQIESGAGSENALSRTEARAYRQKLSGILKRVDAEVPAYAQARQSFAGNSDLLEAAQSGAEHFSPGTSASYLQRTLPERFPTAGERSEYNTNAINAFVQKVRNLAANPDLPQSARGTNLVQRLMGTADAGAKLRMLFPDDASYQGFISQMEQEAAYPKTAGFFTNQSSTAGQLAESKMNPAVLRDLAFSPFSNHARMNLLSRAMEHESKMSPETANLIGQRAIQTGPAMQQMIGNRYIRKLGIGSTVRGAASRTVVRGAAQNDPFQR